MHRPSGFQRGPGALPSTAHYITLHSSSACPAPALSSVVLPSAFAMRSAVRNALCCRMFFSAWAVLVVRGSSMMLSRAAR